MAKRLNVFLKGILVGELEQDNSGSLHFRYTESWIGSKPSIPLSTSMPLRKERYGQKVCRPFFAGLLPEATSRQLIAKSFGVSDKNDFALLERIGAECAGAVSLIPPDETPTAEASSYREITSEELAARFDALPSHPLLTGTEGIRLSLAGAQGKLAVAIRDGKFSLPLGGSPSSHILKPPNPHFKGLVQNEFFCMRLADRGGLEVAPVELGKAGETPFLQVERFDRERMPDGSLERIHQEDFCQALAIPPELKYQQEGGPSLKKSFALVREVSSAPGPDVLKLFDAVVFNYLIGNSDAHGKNFSFLYTESGARLAPLYDLVSTQAYPDLSRIMAMKIGDENEATKIHVRNWRKFFTDARLGQAGAQRRLLGLGKRFLRETEAMIAESIPGANIVAATIIGNCRTLLSREWEK
jgi:serine/threonine-protein kinase HipA